MAKSNLTSSRKRIPRLIEIFEKLKKKQRDQKRNLEDGPNPNPSNPQTAPGTCSKAPSRLDIGKSKKMDPEMKCDWQGNINNGNSEQWNDQLEIETLHLDSSVKSICCQLDCEPDLV